LRPPVVCGCTSIGYTVEAMNPLFLTEQTMQVKAVNLWRRALISVGALVLAIASPSASATTTLDWEVSNISCGLTDLVTGNTLYGDCDTLSFAVRAFSGQVAFLRATISYHYTDDGLPIDYPARFQTDTFGAGTIATFESGGFLATGSGCVRPNCNPDFSGVGFQTEILGLNDQPDDFSGSVTFSTYVSPSTPSQLPVGGTLFIDVRPIIFTAPVPEPATWALMACGLLGLAVQARRRVTLPSRPPNTRHAPSTRRAAPLPVRAAWPYARRGTD
jgi:hypothetical protein